MSDVLCYEPSTLSRRGLLAGFGVLVATLIVATIVSLVLVGLWWPAPPSLEGARLAPDLAATRARVEADWKSRAETYAPIPGDPEVARIPITRAIELRCEDGGRDAAR